MRECICTTCKNLVSVVGENGPEEDFECRYGYPAPQCEACETGECELTCEHYVDEEEPDQLINVQCCQCGKVLENVPSDGEEGEIYCVECYLKRG